MLGFNWKFLTPLSLVVLMVTAVLVKLLEGASLPVYVLVLLGANLVIGWITVSLLRGRVRLEQRRVAEPKPFAAPPAKPEAGNQAAASD